MRGANSPLCLRSYLQSREMEYLMGVNALYESTHFHLISSYKRAFANDRVSDVDCVRR